MSRHATRDSVFTLSDSEQAMLDRFKGSGLSAGGFIKAHKINRLTFYGAIEKQRCMLRAQADAAHFGTTSLARARGRLRMDGTK